MTDSSIRTRSDERPRAEQSESTEQADEREECPECGGRLVSDTEHAETVCEDCGLVVEA
ncbi:TFIIB-type zinc ribbon-containing protein, partial [Halopiger djelfimassiliensis]|uniref:TFIIB-type zinc ribbon-containing protein n=1 Tax=Halopiger djelfimassiliensis TaxID=1293047 RepID=UPI002DD86DC2